jgi:hypothetical protein
VTFFALQRLSRYAGQIGFSRQVGPHAEARRRGGDDEELFSPRTPRLRVSPSGQKQQVPSSRMEGAVTIFPLQRLSRYAGQIGFSRHGQGAASRANVNVQRLRAA